MVDWNGLFQWSISYQDGTQPTSQFKEMTPEDRKWLEEALKQYTFNDADRLKEACAELKSHMTLENDKTLQLLEEVLELVEMHPRNNLNICICGGMLIMFDIVSNSPNEAARREACSIISYCAQNNPEVQTIMQKQGALNLMHQYPRETNIKNKESVIGALSSFLRGYNIEAKQQFLTNFSGMSFLKQILFDSQSQSVRLYKKVLFMMYDFVLCDDQIFGKEDLVYVRRQISSDQDLLKKLVGLIKETDLDDYQQHDARESILRILVYIVNYKTEILDEVKPILEQHKKRLEDKIKVLTTDFIDLLSKELELIEEVYKAPFTKIKSNFQGEEEVNVLHLKDDEENKESKQEIKALGI